MEWLTGLFGAGTAGIAGGLFGVLGGVVNRLFDYLAIKEKTKSDKQQYDHEYNVLKMETDRDIAVAKSEATAKMEVAESEALGKSYDSDRATYLSPPLVSNLSPWASGFVACAMAVVDFVRGMTRPGITLYLCVLTTILYVQIQQVITAAGGEPITKAMAYALISQIIQTILFLTTMAVGWWFATRPSRSAAKE